MRFSVPPKIFFAAALLGIALFRAAPASAAEDPGAAPATGSWSAAPADAGAPQSDPGAVPAAAAVPAPPPPKKAEVPFREDAGLITAEYYLATGKYAQALDVVAAVLLRHPDSADAYTYRGYAYQRLGDVKKAKEAYGRALTLNPAHLGANKYIAGIYLQEGDLDRALEQLQVMRLTCGTADCQEMDELEADVNHYRQGQHENPTARQPAVDTRYFKLNK